MSAAAAPAAHLTAAAAPSADPLARLARRADPADPAAQNNLGVVLARHGRPAEAREAFARALALDPGMALARRNLVAAAPPEDDAAHERGLRARVRADGGNAEAWRALVRFLSARGRHDDARAALDRWDDAAPGHEAPAAERARVELAGGRPEAALAALATARERAPAVAAVALDVLAARAVYQQGDAPAALALLDRVRAAAPDDADAELLRSFVLGEIGAATAAAAARARAAVLNPALGRAEENLALPAGGAAESPRHAAPNGSRPDGGRGLAEPSPIATTDAPGAALALARALRRKGYVREAADALAPARGAADDAVLAREAGELLLLAGRAAEAAGAWDAVLAFGGADAAAWLNLGVARALGGSGRGAGEAFARAAELARGTCAEAWALAGLAHEARAAGRCEEACDLLRRAAGAAREASAAPRAALASLLARALSAAGRHGEARRAGAAAERLAPAWAHAACAHGQVLAAAGAHAEAREAYARAADLAPHDAAARYGLAFAAAACGDHAAARAETARALGLAPVVPPLPWPLVADVGELLVCGVDQQESRRLTPAEAILSDADAHTADDRLASLFGVTGAQSAAAVGEASEQVAPALTVAFADADALMAVGEHDRAVAALSRALARRADRGAALARMALAYERQGFFGESLERYDEALDAGMSADVPDAAEPRRGRARMLVALGRWADADRAARAAAAAVPTDARAHALAARAAAARGDDAAAHQRAEHAEWLAHSCSPSAGLGVAVTPDVLAETWGAVADAWRAVDQSQREADAWAQVEAVAPADSRAPLAGADALLRAGEVETARGRLEALVETRPNDADAALALARLVVEAGDAEGAVPLLAGVVVRDPWHVEALARLALALVAAGRGEEAARSAERALRLDRDHALAHLAAASVAVAAGLRPRAASHARRAVELEPAGEAARRARTLLASLADEAAVHPGAAV